MSVLSPFVFSTGGGGGVDLSAYPLTVLDVSDGSWTHRDTDDIVSSVDVTSDVTTITYNQISVGSNDYAYGANVTNCTAARWYKALTDANGDAIVGGDSFILMMEIDNTDDFSGDGATQTFVGIGSDPSSDTRNTASMIGMVEQHTTSETAPDYAACVARFTSSNLTNANNKRGRAMLYCDKGVVSDITCTATGTSTTYGPTGRNPAITYSASAPIYLVVGAGTRGADTVPSEGTSAQIIRYTVIKLES